MCPSLLQDLARVAERTRAAARISLFLDFDGTLAPLRPDPAEVRLDPRIRDTLAWIGRNHRVSPAIISGRALSDLRSRIGLEGLFYAGNHGLEIYGRQMHFIEPVAAARRKDLWQLSRQVAAKLKTVAGAFVEYKGLTTSIHYRRTAIRQVARIEEVVRDSVLSAADSFRVTTGKMVFEVVPRTGWHKGAAVRWINSQLGDRNRLSIYVGDDETDEDAFRALPQGITVRVGCSSATSARHHLPDSSAVHEFLIWLADHEHA